VIDLRHDENPSEMRWLVAVRRNANGRGMRLAATGSQGWIAPRFPKSKAITRQ
jgi:hypothetical protein